MKTKSRSREERMLLSFKKDIFVLAVKAPDFSEDNYVKIKNSLLQRQAEISKEDELHDVYQQAIHTTEIVEYIHKNFSTKMNSLAEYYNRIKKIPFAHALINRNPYRDYIFHAEEYQGSGISFTDKINRIAKQLAIFIEQFLTTYKKSYTNEDLDWIVNWTETLCFDAQIEGRYLNYLLLRFIDANLNNEEDKNLLLQIRNLSRKMIIPSDKLSEKITALAMQKKIAPEQLDSIKSKLEKSSNRYFTH